MTYLYIHICIYCNVYLTQFTINSYQSCSDSTEKSQVHYLYNQIKEYDSAVIQEEMCMTCIYTNNINKFYNFKNKSAVQKSYFTSSDDEIDSFRK